MITRLNIEEFLGMSEAMFLVLCGLWQFRSFRSLMRRAAQGKRGTS